MARAAATKVAISIPGPLYQAMEGVRKATGKSRSAVIQDALRYWLDHQAHAPLVAEYQAGYRRRPEGPVRSRRPRSLPSSCCRSKSGRCAGATCREGVPHYEVDRGRSGAPWGEAAR